MRLFNLECCHGAEKLLRMVKIIDLSYSLRATEDQDKTSKRKKRPVVQCYSIPLHTIPENNHQLLLLFDTVLEKLHAHE